MATRLITEAETRAKAALLESPIFMLRVLCVEQLGDALLLSGRVDTYYHKQLAQEAVRAVAGELQVINSIEVD